MDFIEKYNSFFKSHLSTAISKEKPTQLYDPIHYILRLGGKRLRPILTLMSCDVFGTPSEKAINAALAVELFHNFSLIHDDIMDRAPLRRGKETVHEKWDVNTAILSGDALLILAYQFFESYEPKLFLELAKLFSETALKVCEGQQYDVDFEKREDVSLREYIDMIDCKTAVLLGAAMKMGAMVAKADEDNKNNIYKFGQNLGLAFQLQDDYLDVYGSSETFGKQVGGDIIANKKTFLFIHAFKNADLNIKNELLHLFNINPKNPSSKVDRTTEIFTTTGAPEAILQAILDYTEKANYYLKKLQITDENMLQLEQFGKKLMDRKV